MKAVVADIAGGAAVVSVVSAIHEFSFHEFIGTAAGCMAIAYYLYTFVKWCRSHWDNHHGD